MADVCNDMKRIGEKLQCMTESSFTDLQSLSLAVTHFCFNQRGHGLFVHTDSSWSSAVCHSRVCFFVTLFSFLLFSLQIDASPPRLIYLLLTLSPSVFTFLPPPPLLLFSGLDCFQEPDGVMPALSLSLSARVSPCPRARLPVCVLCFPSRPSQPVSFIPKCRILLFANSSPHRPGHNRAPLAFALFALHNCVCVGASALGLHKCNYLCSLSDVS